MLDMYEQIIIKTLHKQGKKKSDIAREVKCHRNTVRNVLKRKKLIKKQSRNKPSYFDKYKIQIKQYLNKKYSRLRIYEILKEEYNISKSYDNLCKYIQKHFPKKQEAFGVQITQAGEEAEVDFGYVGMYPDNYGNLVKTYIFVISLSYSRKIYAGITANQQISSVIKTMEDSFKYFEGVPLKVKVDNMRTAVLKNHRYDLEFNQDFLEFSLHYGFIIKPCTPFQPNQKGKVESNVKYIKNNFFVGRTFTSHNNMQNQLLDWLDNYANKRVHGTTKKIPDEVFLNEEKSKLQPLPDNPFVFFNRSNRIVKVNSHISFNNNYYSVPCNLIKQQVTIRWNNTLLRILNDKGKEVAVHKICNSNGEYITQRSHLPEYKYYSETEYQTKYEMKMKEIGDSAHKYFQVLLEKRKGYWGRIIRSILGMCQIYEKERINLTLKRALEYDVFDIPTIKNICEKQTYLLEIQKPLLKTLQNVETDLSRDPSYYEQIYLN